MSYGSSPIAPTQVVQWLGLEFRVPEAWEIARHGVRFESGSLVFIDRVQQRLSVSWTECPRSPDLERLYSDFEARARADGERLQNQREQAGFHVFERERTPSRRALQALKFEPRSKRLIELELSSRDDAERGLVDALLASFAFAARTECAKLCAFSVRAELPPGFELCASNVKPADVSFEFARRAASASDRVRVRRSGMARAWFDGDAARATRERNPALRFASFESTRVGPHGASSGLGSTQGAALQRIFRRSAPLRVTSWHCPAQNAVFELTASARFAEREQCRLWCCGEAEESANHER